MAEIFNFSRFERKKEEKKFESFPIEIFLELGTKKKIQIG